jgi:hypothetical protein
LRYRPLSVTSDGMIAKLQRLSHRVLPGEEGWATDPLAVGLIEVRAVQPIRAFRLFRGANGYLARIPGEKWLYQAAPTLATRRGRVIGAG